jgi:hypothetical protein
MSRLSLVGLTCLWLGFAWAMPSAQAPPPRFFDESVCFPFPPSLWTATADDSAAVPEVSVLPVLQRPPEEIPAGATAASARGIVAQWRRCPAGLVQGARLEDGTEIRFPSYPPDPLAELAPADEPVEVLGWRFPSETILHARWIRNPKSAELAEVDLPPL